MNCRTISMLCAVATLAAMGSTAAETPRPAPACDLEAFDSPAAFDMRQLAGDVLYVDFWASWCTSCAKSFPFLNALHREFREDGLRIVGINLDEDIDDAKAFLAKRPAEFVLAVDASGQCPRAFGVTAMPSSYLVDREGTIRHVLVGFRSGEAEDVRRKVQQLLAEQPARPQPAAEPVP
jgi:thiol-disulfide isomerase/thioredoxin